MVLGDGQERENLLELRNKLELMDVIEMPGFVSNPYQIISNSDCFVLSSKWEGWPNSLLESPCLWNTWLSQLTALVDLGKYLKNGKLGFLVKVGDAENLSEAIYNTLNDPVASDMLIQRAKEFTPEKAAAMYLNIALS